MHSLVRSVLLADLRRRSPARLAEQHARAARWFQDAGEVPTALEHWLQAGRPRDALRLLAVSHAELYDSGRVATIRRTIAGFPPSLGAADVESTIELAWCNLWVDHRRFRRARRPGVVVGHASRPRRHPPGAPDDARGDRGDDDV